MAGVKLVRDIDASVRVLNFNPRCRKKKKDDDDKKKEGKNTAMIKAGSIF